VRADLVLTLARPEFRSSSVAEILQPALVGEVLQLGTRVPLEGASVELVDSTGASVARTLSGADGAFRIVLDEGGTLRVRIERLGYASALSEPLDLTNGARRVEVLLPEEPIEIDPIVVVVEGRVDKLEREGFYARALTRPGVFMRRDDVDALDPVRTSDLLGRAPGVLVRSFSSLRPRVVFRMLALTEGEQCWASLFIDGELVQVGGVRNEAPRPGEESQQGVVKIWPLDDEIPKSVDEFVRPQEIEAVEMYRRPELVPQRFVGLGARCGAIVIWTREAGDRDPGPRR
ncbi:MAG: carboxypeptidase-like regulatory domain-containing protein, partial [Thermoanaerobaculales bacterium]